MNLEAGGEPAGSVACLGEALALLPGRADEDGSAAASDGPGGTLAGAEANVAAALAAMHVPAAWVGRLGTDAIGRLVDDELRRRGVDVTAVQRDPTRPTGYYTKHPVEGATGERTSRMVYHRAGSAASAMGPGLLEDGRVRAVLSAARLIHTSGITAALSPSCADLMRRLLSQPRPFGATVSYDVNWREQLWPSGDTGLVVELAGLADIVLVGADESARVLGTSDPLAIRTLLPGPEWVIVKDGARRALAVHRDGTVLEQRALSVEVVEPVGAGDAFAAGYLAGVVRGEDTLRCLRRGHLNAAAVLTVTGDSAPAHLTGAQRLLDVPDATWEAAVVAASGVRFLKPAGGAERGLGPAAR